MKEDCATGMSTTHGCNNDKAIVETFMEALKQRVGEDAYRVWFSDGISYEFVDVATTNGAAAKRSTKQLTVTVPGQFALERLRKNHLQAIRGAAASATGGVTKVELVLGNQLPTQAELPLGESGAVETVQANGGKKKKRNPRPKKNRQPSTEIAQPALPGFVVDQEQPEVESEIAPSAVSPAESIAKQTFNLENFLVGDCNRLAYTAAMTACQTPKTASPLYFFGPTGIGKSHLLAAIADRFRRVHRMRRVVHLSAETFTNEFIACVNTSGLPAFRARYRDVDALIVDDIHFIGSKRATTREMLYTIQTIADSGRPIILAATSAPSEISDLGQELAGRLASGLVCPIGVMSSRTRDSLLRQTAQEVCEFTWPESTLMEISELVVGDGRVIRGIVNLVRMLHGMLGRMPTMDEIRHYGGELLRAAKPAVTLNRIERAVAEAFQLPSETLRSQLKTRSASQPRMLAMYLSRQLTSCAFTEIGRFYGGRSHSTAIVASKRVEKWIQDGSSIGRGSQAVSVRAALDRIESILRAS